MAAAARPAARRGRSTEENDGRLAGLARAGLRFEVGLPAPGAATITLDRSQRRNAMTPGMWSGLAAIGQARPPEVRVVVVQGAGPSFRPA